MGRLTVVVVAMLALSSCGFEPVNELIETDAGAELTDAGTASCSCTGVEGIGTCPRGDPNTPCGPCSPYGTPAACRAWLDGGMP